MVWNVEEKLEQNNVFSLKITNKQAISRCMVTFSIDSAFENVFNFGDTYMLTQRFYSNQIKTITVGMLAYQSAEWRMLWLRTLLVYTSRIGTFSSIVKPVLELPLYKDLKCSETTLSTKISCIKELIEYRDYLCKTTTWVPRQCKKTTWVQRLFV